jgi:plastocyanin
MRKAANEVGLGGGVSYGRQALVALAAIAVLAIALSACGSGGSETTAGKTEAQGADDVKLVVKSDEQEAKKGPDGKWHDAFLPADFPIEAGDVVHVTVYNYDDMPHSFTSPELGVNEKIVAGSEEKPSKTTFTFHAPRKAGAYEWFCALPCDPWAMSHKGFMRGTVTVA